MLLEQGGRRDRFYESWHTWMAQARCTADRIPYLAWRKDVSMFDPMMKKLLAHWLLGGSAALFPFLWAVYKLIITQPR
jgi:hypothetical protein